MVVRGSTARLTPSSTTGEIESVVSRWAAQIASGSDANRVRALVEKIKSALIPDYAAEAEVFAAAYQMINFWKALKSLRTSGLPAPRVIVDIGCGSGASAAASVAYAIESDANIDQVQVCLIDQSQAQLDLAVACLDRVQDVVSGVQISVRAINLQFPRSAATDLEAIDADLVICAHVLTENLDPSEFLDAAYGLTSSGGALLVVERRDDPIWAAVEGWSSPILADQPTGRANTPVLDHIVHGTRSWRTRWMVITQPASGPAVGLLRAYFQAWAERDVQALLGIFSNEAVYREKPHRPPVVGLDAIETYWREKVSNQRDIRFHFSRLSEIPGGAVVEWECTFSNSEYENNKVSGMMIVELNAEHDRIVELREYFRARHAGPSVKVM